MLGLAQEAGMTSAGSAMGGIQADARQRDCGPAALAGEDAGCSRRGKGDVGEEAGEESAEDVNSSSSALGPVSRNAFASKITMRSTGRQCLLRLVLTPRCCLAWTVSTLAELTLRRAWAVSFSLGWGCRSWNL